MDQALQTLFAACAADTACHTAYPNLKETFFATVASLRDKPVLLGTGADAALVNDALYLNAVAQLLGSPELAGEIAAGLDSDLVAAAPQLWRDYVTGFYQGANWSVQCYEALRLGPGPAQIMPEVPDYLLNYAIMQPESSPRLVDLCTVWGVPVADQKEAQPVSSDVPVLLLAGTLDVLTPPIEAERVAATLPNSTVVTMPTPHGGAVWTPCGSSIAQAFLADPTLAPDISCEREETIEFAPVP